MSALENIQSSENNPPARSEGGALIRFPASERTELNNLGLIERYQNDGDKKALESLIARNQGLLHAVLHRFLYFDDPYEDLLQVANLGLIKAAQRFDLDSGNEFSSYASAIVDGEVRHYLRDNVLMRQPRWLRQAEKNIDQASIELSRRFKRNPTIEEIAQEVNISVDGVLEILRYSAMNGVHSIDDGNDTEKSRKQLDSNSIKSQRYESFLLPIEDKIVLDQALGALSAFQRNLVYLLFYKDLTQTEVAKRLGLNQRRVSRESAKALGRLRAVLNTKIF